MELWKFSRATFGMLIFCFFLPFLSASCAGQKLVTLSGLQLAIGTTLEEPNLFGETREKQIGGEPLAAAALLAAGFGLVLSLVRRSSRTGGRVAGVVGVVSLSLLKNKIDVEVLREGGGMIQVDYEFGFWIALLLFAVVIALNSLGSARAPAKGTGMEEQLPPVHSAA